MKADIDPAIISAYRRTGLIVTTENQHLLSKEDPREWNAALTEYGEKLKGQAVMKKLLAALLLAEKHGRTAN